MTVIPVQRLGAIARDAYLAHLQALGSEDVRLRFGASLSRDAIARYVHAIDFERDAILGVHGEGMRLTGAAHLAFGPADAELGLSVLAESRRQGAGGALIARASEHARNRASKRLFMHCLAENGAMMRLARRAGMQVVVEAGDADAHVALPPATPMSVTSEMIADRVALYDYALKTNVETWRRVGAALVGGS